MRTCLMLLAALALGFAPAPFIPRKPIAAPAAVPDIFTYQEFHGVRWRDVFRYLSEETGKPVTFGGVAGTCTLIPPVRGKNMTRAELLDALNRELATVRRRIVERPRSFIVVTDDE